MRFYPISFYFRAFVLAALLLSPVAIRADEPTGSIETPEILPVRVTEIDRLYQDGSRRKAYREAKKWIDEEKSSPWPYVAMAQLRYRDKKFKKSLSLSETALKKDPQNAEAFYWRGQSYEAMDKPLDAANEYRAALHAEENFSKAQDALNRVSVVLGARDEEPNETKTP